DWDGLPALAAAIDTAEPEAPLFALTGAVSRLLAFDPFEAGLLRAAVALARLPRLYALRRRLTDAGFDMLPLLGRLAGSEDSDSAARVRRSGPVSLGLLRIDLAKGGGYSVDLDWIVSRLLDGGSADEDALIDALAGIRQAASLGPDDFVEHRETLNLLERLLRGALQRQARGISVLIHGPPGTGKTEFARTLAAAAGAELFAVGECDEDGEEPTRWERLHALKRSERLLARRGNSLLLFDEMEDLFAATSLCAGGRAGSKIFVNRLLEGARVPVIWTSNALDDVDPAHLRRMSFILRMDHPSPNARARIAGRAAEAEGVPDAAAGLRPFLSCEAESASIARVALRGAALAGGGATDAEAAARSLLLGLRGGRSLAPGPSGGALDLALYESDIEIAPLIERLSAPAAPRDFSLLLTGPPGTGKTALAAHMAERLDRPLQVKRASDLLSKWVGGTEANIAEAFAEARDQGVGLAVRRGRFASPRSKRLPALVGDHPGERDADLDGFAPFALRRGNQLRPAARSGGAPAVRLQDRPWDA
ncbi:MAG: AAA family ATPase, partial [Allosphingosinicella sp.]